MKKRDDFRKRKPAVRRKCQACRGERGTWIKIGYTNVWQSCLRCLGKGRE